MKGVARWLPSVLVAAVLLVFLQWVARDDAWKHEVNSKLVGRGPNGWHRENMEAWRDRLQEANPDIVVPPLPEWHE